MALLAERFRKLKMRIPGNRECGIYEWKYGVKPEMTLGIHGPSTQAERLLGQLEFSIRLSASQEGRFDKEIDTALSVAEDGLTADGDVTAQTLAKVEAMLMSLSAEAKKYTVLCTAHAHIDMNWLWGYPETVAITLGTFETILRFMDEYPRFTFSQSQGAVYEIVERFAPEMKAKIQKRIQEGRWEVTASSWVEQDKNMPDLESMARHLLYTKSYLKRNWGVDPDQIVVDFSPDTFGHCGNMPEILNQCGVHYYYHCRGYAGPHHLYRWRSPSGAEVIAYREGLFYIGTITHQLGATALELANETNLKTALCVYGVGDHGGGPTRRDIERILDLDTWPIFPRFRFGTYREYFQLAESVRTSLPIVDHPLNFHAPGCYTTQTRIKRFNKQTEAALQDAETFACITSLFEKQLYRTDAFADAWKKFLFNHFHDILTGSCVRDAREHAIGLYQDAQATAMAEQMRSLHSIASKICSEDDNWPNSNSDTAEGAGVGFGMSNGLVPMQGAAGGPVRVYHVFNSLPYRRDEVVELPLWDWEDDLRQFAVKDLSTGQMCECQLIDAQRKTYWIHQVVRVLARVKLPPMGYTTISLYRKQDDEYPLTGMNWTPIAPVWDKNIVLENDLLCAVFDSRTAQLISLIDKTSGAQKTQNAGFYLIEEDLAMGTAWVIGRRGIAKELREGVRISDVQTGQRDSAYQLEMLRNFGGPEVIPDNLKGSLLRQSFTFEQPISDRSSLICRVALDQGKAELVYDATIRWNETADAKTKTVPQLSFAMKPDYVINGYVYDTPGGKVTLSDRNGDVPGLTYGAAKSAEGSSLYLTSDAKYGYRGNEGVLSMTLLRSPAHPDPEADLGTHSIRFALGVDNTNGEHVHMHAKCFAHKPVVVLGRVQSGELPPCSSYLTLEDEEHLMLAAVKGAEKGNGMILRLFAEAEQEGRGVFRFAKNILHAETVDFLERPCTATAQIATENNLLRITLPKGCITSICVRLEEGIQ